MFNSFIKKSVINPGDKFSFKGSNGNPFDKTSGARVEVIQVLKGWVNYKMLPDTGIFINESMEISSFRYCYKKHTGD